jgi:hypothetical protein
MTVTLHLKPEIEAGLLMRANASGMALEEYLLSLVEVAARLSGDRTVVESGVDRREAVKRMLAFGEKHCLNAGEPITRASLHEGHRF